MSANDVMNHPNGTEKIGILGRLFRLSPLGSKPPPESNEIYYGVYIPCEFKIGPDEEKLHVYTERADALVVARKYKRARFKSFKNHQEAVAFALQGTEPLPDRIVIHNGSFNNEKNNTLIANVGEKPSLFKGPKPQEMVLFRKDIEAGNLIKVKQTAWDNPRYLISSGDTPSILQEGSRYNALHVAVKSRNVEMCELILMTISDPEFVERLYGDDNVEFCKARASILLDLYLNTPDKSINETPLHFASKFGCKDIVDLLVSYPQCLKNLRNKFGEEAVNMICTRHKDSNPELESEISNMLHERFYVPVLHSEDNSEQPIIGEPFSPGSPPSLKSDTLSPRVEIRAFAGPMNKAEAYTFRKKWKTPPRLLNNSIRTPLAAARFRLKDTEKGLEKAGRDLAQQLDVEWQEYWPFLDTFTNLTSQEGLGLFENYLKNEYISTWNETNNDSLQISPESPFFNQNLSDFDSKLNNTIEHKPKTSFIEPELSPMTGLCSTFNSLSINCNNREKYSTSPKAMLNRTLDFKMKFHDPENENVKNLLMNPGLNPYICIEKLCQVFAKRLEILTESDFNIEFFKTEIKHLQQTICSYMDDPRFHTIEFDLIHSRVAQITALKLANENSLDNLKKFTEISELSDQYSSDEDDYIISNRPQFKRDRNRKHQNEILKQIKCLSRNILKWMSNENFSDSKSSLTEDDYISIWSNMYRCNCSWQTEQFFRNCRKNASLKRSQIKSRESCDILSSSPKLANDAIPKKLIFDCEIESDLKIINPSTPESDGNHNIANVQGKTLFIDESVVPEIHNDDNDKYFDNCAISDDEDAYLSPLSSSDSDSDFEDAIEIFGDMQPVPSIDAFIYGDKPTKADKIAYDAICNYYIDVTKYPYVYRWRHTISLYPAEVRDRWLLENSSPDDLDSPITCSFNLGHISNFGSSTPTKKPLKNIYSVSMDETNLRRSRNCVTPTKAQDAVVNMQVSKWKRVTGPNSPKSTLMNRSQGPNYSLNF